MNNTLLIRSFLLSMLLVETFDELEEELNYKHSLKQKGNQFKKELEKYCNTVADNCDELSLSTDYVNKISKKLDKLIEHE